MADWADSSPAKFRERVPDLIASLCEVVTAEGLDSKELIVGLEAGEQKKIRIKDRHSVLLHAGEKSAIWTAPSLREMFRGKEIPPSDSEMNRYPPEYCELFYFVEERVLLLCDAVGDRTDQEFEEVYTMLRRRPDAKSLGPAHDFLWQVAALMLGMYPISDAEFNSIFGQMARSARHWAQRPISRNYIEYLRRTFHKDGELAKKWPSQKI